MTENRPPIPVEDGGGVVSYEEMRDGSIDPDGTDYERQQEGVLLLDPIKAYAAEAARMAAAGPRRRITADDLDRIRSIP